MQQHQVHKYTVLVPHLWFIKQQIEKGGNKAGGKVMKAKFPFWNSRFWTLSCCSVWNVLYGLPSHCCHPPQGVCWAEAPRSVVVSTQTSQCSGPLLLLSCWQVWLVVCSTSGLVCHFLLLAPPSVLFLLGKGIASLQRNGFNSLEEAGDQSPLYMLEYIGSICISM